MTMCSYIVDNYPEHSIEVVTFYSVIINVSRMLVTIAVRCGLLTYSSFRLSSLHGSFFNGKRRWDGRGVSLPKVSSASSAYPRPMPSCRDTGQGFESQ